MVQPASADIGRTAHSNATREAARRSQAALLETEALALTAMRAVVTGAVQSLASRMAVAAGRVVAQASIEAALTDTIIQARRAARRASRATAAAELDVIRRDLSRYGLPGPSVQAVMAAVERDDAVAAARAYAGPVLMNAQARASGGARGNHLRAAVEANDWRLQRIAATEVAGAFNDERERIAAELATDSGAAWFPAVFKFWDARMDACRRCKDQHGRIRHLGLRYPHGQVPGRVHPHCRCVSLFAFVPLYLGRSEAA